MTLQIVILFLSVFLSGLLVISLPKLKTSTFNFLLTLVGSYLLSLTILHLLPDLFAFHASTYFVGLYVLGGFFLQLLLDIFTKGVEHGHMEHKQQDYSKISPLGLFISLCIHAFLDGVILNNATLVIPTSVSMSINTRLLIGMLFHKASEAFALVSVLKNILNRRSLVFKYLLGFSLASPFGLWFSKYCSQSLLFNQKIFIALAAMAVGNLLHISTTIFSESIPHHRVDRKTILAIMGGMFFMIILEYIL